MCRKIYFTKDTIIEQTNRISYFLIVDLDGLARLSIIVK